MNLDKNHLYWLKQDSEVIQKSRA